MSSPGDWRRVPLARRLCVEPSSGRTGVALSTLTGATDLRRRVLDRIGTLAVGLVGAPNLAVHGGIDWPADGLAQLGGRLHDELPTLRLIGGVLPRQEGRRRLSMLGRMTGNTVAVKVGAYETGIEREAEVLKRLAVSPLPGIATPSPLAHGHVPLVEADGTVVEVAYLVTFGLAVGRQRPAMDAPLRTFERDLAARLADLPRPSGTPADHVPIHGDLAPYNLRRTPRGLALFDWESAGWGPPGSDVELYRRRCELIRARRPIPPPAEMLESL